MLLQLKDVFINEGSSQEVSYEMDMSKVELDGYYPFISPVSVFSRVENRADLISLNVKVKFTLSHPCDRCLSDVIKEYEYKFEHILVVAIDDDRNDEFIAVPEYEIDLDELLRADILLELPSKYLCSDNCKGICPKCGKNLNIGSCDCNTTHIDPRLEVLKKLIE